MLDPGSRISEQQQQQRGGEKVFVLPFLQRKFILKEDQAFSLSLELGQR
jgi:hypothetical protein